MSPKKSTRKNTTKKLTIRLDSDDLDKITQAASAAYMSVNKFMIATCVKAANEPQQKSK